jgi:hypothetical protein
VQALESLLSLGYWPIWIGLTYQLAAASIYWITGKVPNSLTIATIAIAWVVAILGQTPGLLPPTGGGIVSSLICTAACFAALKKIEQVGLGGGCMKSQTAFGAWMGCALPFDRALLMCGFATTIGIAMMGVFMMMMAHRYDRPANGSRPDGSQTGEQEFPAQTAVSLGSICGVLLAFTLGAQGPPPVGGGAVPQAAAAPAGGIN